MSQECALFAGRIGASGSSRLHLVSLRLNQIGAMEQRNIQNPSFVTGPEAFAESLSSPQCTLQTIDLGGYYDIKENNLFCSLSFIMKGI